MNPIEQVRARVAAAFARFRMRPENGRVLVACSGGPDSSVLLDALLPLGLELHVASVDHGLRPEAAQEVSKVVAEATALGLPAAALRVTVGKRTMAEARRARYAALVEHAAAVGAGALAVGHTASDQAETLLDRMLRGAGLRGLSAMAPVRALGAGLRLVRPMLGVTSSEVEAYVAARGLSVVRDPTNSDAHYRRSRLRHQVLPLLRAERPDADRALAELAERLRRDAETLDLLAADAHAGLSRGGALDGSLDVGGLMALPAGLRARVLMLACPAPLESQHLESLVRLCEDPRGTHWLSLRGQVVAERAYGWLRFGPPAEDPGDAELSVEAAGSFSLLGLAIEVPGPMLASGPLTLRNLRPGDRVEGGKKLKEILIDRKIPRGERRHLPLLARPGGEVVWMHRVVGEKSAIRPVVHALTRRSGVQ